LLARQTRQFPRLHSLTSLIARTTRDRLIDIIAHYSFVHKPSPPDDSPAPTQNHCSLLIAHSPPQPARHWIASLTLAMTASPDDSPATSYNSLASLIARTTRNSRIDIIAHCSLLIRSQARSHGQLATPKSTSLLIAQYSLLITHYSLLIRPPACSPGRPAIPESTSLLIAHCSLLIHL
jgi:hypothetical protein